MITPNHNTYPERSKLGLLVVELSGQILFLSTAKFGGADFCHPAEIRDKL